MRFPEQYTAGKVYISPPLYMILENHHFFGEGMRDSNGIWRMWTYMLGTKEECAEYIFTVKLISGTSEDISHTGPCVPLDVATKEINNFGSFLKFDDELLKDFIEPL